MGVPENTVQDVSYDCVYESIETDASKHQLSDTDVWCAWKTGLAAYMETRKLGGKFPHDPTEAEDKIEKIAMYCEAYPLDIFPEPDLKRAARALKDNGMTLDAISASAARHVLNGIKAIIDG